MSNALADLKDYVNERSDDARLFAIYEAFSREENAANVASAAQERDKLELRQDNWELRVIVDALANEAMYQAMTREGSAAYIARIKEEAQLWLESHPLRS